MPRKPRSRIDEVFRRSDLQKKYNEIYSKQGKGKAKPVKKALVKYLIKYELNWLREFKPEFLTANPGLARQQSRINARANAQVVELTAREKKLLKQMENVNGAEAEKLHKRLEKLRKRRSEYINFHEFGSKFEIAHEVNAKRKREQAEANRNQTNDFVSILDDFMSKYPKEYLANKTHVEIHAMRMTIALRDMKSMKAKMSEIDRKMDDLNEEIKRLPNGYNTRSPKGKEMNARMVDFYNEIKPMREKYELSRFVAANSMFQMHGFPGELRNIKKLSLDQTVVLLGKCKQIIGEYWDVRDHPVPNAVMFTAEEYTKRLAFHLTVLQHGPGRKKPN